jgi:uncharacterized protein YecE (DUF72 family)
MYRYTYTDTDLSWLLGTVRGLKADTVYVLFNNDTMARDAQRFRAPPGGLGGRFSRLPFLFAPRKDRP